MGEQWTGAAIQETVTPVPTQENTESNITPSAITTTFVGTTQAVVSKTAPATQTEAMTVTPVSTESSVAAPTPASGAIPSSKPLLFYLNDSPIRLPRKKDGMPYYLMDMIEYSGIDLKNPRGKVNLSINGMPGMFQQELREGDMIKIEEEL